MPAPSDRDRPKSPPDLQPSVQARRERKAFERNANELLSRFAQARAFAQNRSELNEGDYRWAMRRLVIGSRRLPTFWDITPDFGFSAAGSFASAGVGVFVCGGEVGLGWALVAAGITIAALSAMLRYRPPFAEE